MKAPRGHTNAPSRKLSLYVAPYEERWVRERAEGLLPDMPATGPQSAVSRFLRVLVNQAMEKESNE